MKNGPYELLLAPRKYPGKKYRNQYAYEHHLVWWKETGCIVQKGYEIHHIDGNHRNNKIKNLKLVSAQEHRKIHSDMRRKPRIIFNCWQCGNEKETTLRFFKARLIRNTFDRVFCSNRCGAIYQHYDTDH